MLLSNYAIWKIKPEIIRNMEHLYYGHFNRYELMLCCHSFLFFSHFSSKINEILNVIIFKIGFYIGEFWGSGNSPDRKWLGSPGQR